MSTDIDLLSRIKVLVVTHYYAQHGGGVEVVAEHIARRLADDGRFDLVWAASDTDLDESLSRQGIDPLAMRTFNGLERATGVPYPLWGPRSVLQLFHAVAAADIVHLHECVYAGNVLAFIAARLYGKPVLVTQHVGVIPFRSAVLRSVHKIMNFVLGRVVLGGADACVFISDAVRAYFHGLVPFRRATDFIANGVDLALYHPPADDEAKQQARRNLALGGDRPVLLFVGRFVEKKGLNWLRRMAEQTPGWTWALAGCGVIDPEKWGLPNVRVFRGRRAATLVPLYQAADVFVMPSVGEGFPLVVQEAMACGLPVLTNPDTIAGAYEVAGVIAAESLRSDAGEETVARNWVERLGEMLEDRVALREAGRRAAAYAGLEWSWERCAQWYATTLEKLACEPRKTRRRNPTLRRGRATGPAPARRACP